MGIHIGEEMKKTFKIVGVVAGIYILYQVGTVIIPVAIGAAVVGGGGYIGWRKIKNQRLLP